MNPDEETHGIEVARRKRPAILVHFVETLLHCGEFIGLHMRNVKPGSNADGERRTIGMSSSDTGSLDDNSR